MPLTIGALARRLRVSPRALRHYESLGLLRPSHVDRRTGYRYYGDAELARGLQIEQLKAAGLPLAEIVRILDAEISMAEALQAHRSHVLDALAEHQNQLAIVEAMLETAGQALTPELVEVEPVHALVADAKSAPDDLTGTVRRLVQRLRRDAMRAAGCAAVDVQRPLSARPGPEMATRVAAHLDGPCSGSVVIHGVTAVGIDVVGAHALLPIAQDAAVAETRSRGLRPCGWVWEQYLDIGRLPRTRLLVPVAT